MATFTTSDGVELRYEQRGEGPPVYVCHGGPSNVCDSLMAGLSALEASHTVVFHNYCGSGMSADAPATTYRFDRLADDVDELREHLGHPTIRVLAHSMGGFVALHHALRHPQRCERLALIATTPCGAFGPMAIPTLRALGPLRTAKALAAALRFLAWWSWRPPSPQRTRAMYAPMAVTQEARPALRAKVAAAHPELPADNDNASHLLQAMGSLDLRHALSRVRCPVLVLYGSRDAVMAAGSQMLAAGIEHADVRALADVGHEPFIEAPEPTLTALRHFLRP